jgi:predicted DNA-binding transcriptional regulator YafY
MPRSYSEIIQKGINRVQFIADQEEKAPKRRPRRTGMRPSTGTLFASRNKRLAIREAALRNAQLVITYTKTTTNETKKYVVAPYEFKYLRLKVGRRKMLYAYDMKAKHIKSFALRNVKKVAITDRKFRPKWPIRIA